MLNDLDLPDVLPGEPVDAIPGSPEKIQVLTERASRREQLFHPDDTPGIQRRAERAAKSSRPRESA